ncbi:MAG: hypothetical protein CL424_17910 [Acidimicrobiaceae bacterium]|nr:hypothetical protein [Acidimicrobiaceae bacterium]
MVVGEVVQRATLAYLTLSGLLVGVWATLFPQSFYDDFPGLGLVWVAVDGPYNEHLVRDVGQLSLAMSVVSGVAAFTMVAVLVRVAAAAWLVNAVPHFVYHLRNLEVYDTFDQVGNVLSLGLLVALPVVVLVLSFRPPRSADV